MYAIHTLLKGFKMRSFRNVLETLVGRSLRVQPISPHFPVIDSAVERARRLSEALAVFLRGDDQGVDSDGCTSESRVVCAVFEWFLIAVALLLERCRFSVSPVADIVCFIIDHPHLFRADAMDPASGKAIAPYMVSAALAGSAVFSSIFLHQVHSGGRLSTAPDIVRAQSFCAVTQTDCMLCRAPTL